MAFLPSNPFFAFVSFKIGDLELTPIPPSHLEQFSYERVSRTGAGNKILLTVHDSTATAIESYLANGSRDCEFYFGYTNGNISNVYTGTITQYDPDFTGVGVSLSLEGKSKGLADAIADPKSITYKRMLISDIVKAEADANGWYYTDETIEETAPVLESKEYSITTTLGSSFTGGTDSSGSGGGNTGTLSDGPINDKQQAVINACNSTPTTAAGLCAGWVCNVFDNAGITAPRLTGAKNYFESYCTFSDKSQLKPGMIVACHLSGATGNQWGHIGIYIGNGQVMHSTGQVYTWDLDKWINTYGPNGPKGGGEVKWGWMGGNALA